MYSSSDSYGGNGSKHLVLHTDLDLDPNSDWYDGDSQNLFTGISEYEAKELKLLNCS
jgi:hypothetical protein